MTEQTIDESDDILNIQIPFDEFKEVYKDIIFSHFGIHVERAYEIYTLPNKVMTEIYKGKIRGDLECVEFIEQHLSTPTEKLVMGFVIGRIVQKHLSKDSVRTEPTFDFGVLKEKGLFRRD